MPLPHQHQAISRCFFQLPYFFSEVTFMTLVLFHEASSSFFEKTTLGALFMPSAISGAIWAAAGVGQKLAIRS